MVFVFVTLLFSFGVRAHVVFVIIFVLLAVICVLVFISVEVKVMCLLCHGQEFCLSSEPVNKTKIAMTMTITLVINNAAVTSHSIKLMAYS